MRITLVTSIVPFIDDAGRSVVEQSASALGSAGHHVDVVELPFSETARSPIPQLTAYRTLDLTDLADAVVCFDSPAHLIRHPRKIVWHRARCSAGEAATNVPLRDAIRRVDDAAMHEANRVFAGSESMKQRLRDVHHIDSEVLVPPTNPDRLIWSTLADRLLA